MRTIEVDLDVYSAIWIARSPNDSDENDILRRIFRLDRNAVSVEKVADDLAADTRPHSVKWTDVLIWSLRELGGKATLNEIYLKSRQARKLLSRSITREHDASARECLESHCSDSKKFRGKADLFEMPEGKGSGVWSLR